MALLFPWATKEYLLWEMSLGQIVMYHNLGIDMKYGKPEKKGGNKRLSEMNHSELKEVREELRKQYGEIG